MHTWADQFATYDDACRFYGVDTPAQCKAEAELEAAEERAEWEAHFAEHGLWVSDDQIVDALLARAGLTRLGTDCPF